MVSEVDGEIANLAFHDITPSDTVTNPELKKLLGLSLSFCPTPSRLRRDDLLESLQDFQRRIRLTTMFHDTAPSRTPPKLYVPNREFQPRPSYPVIESIFKSIRKDIEVLPLQHKVRHNLPIHLRKMIGVINQDPNLIVVDTDKNLGPALLTKQQHDDFCLSHLQDPDIYQVVDEDLEECRLKIIQKVQTFADSIPKSASTKIITHNVMNLKLNKFRMLLKVHKKKLAIRPIISNFGAVLSGVSKYLDFLLQPYMIKVPTYIRDSDNLLDSLDATVVPQHCYLVTFDVVSMYTSINLDFAMATFDQFFKNTPIHGRISKGLRLVMFNNFFTFQNKLYLQTKGTAMGTSVAPAFASIYLGIFEDKVMKEFDDHIVFAKRFIDDGFMIWQDNDKPYALKRFFALLTKYSKLRFTFETSSTHVDFLDVTLSLHGSRVGYRTHIKDLNLYLYLPAHSAHPKGVLKSLIFGRILKYHRQNSNQEDFRHFTLQLYRNLTRRGYSKTTLSPLFQEALDRVYDPVAPSPGLQQAVVKIPFDPNGPSKVQLRDLFRAEKIAQLLDGKIQKVTICYKKPKNLRQLLKKKVT